MTKKLEQRQLIKGVKTAILMYDDPKHGPRRVMFGEPQALFDLFWSESQVVYQRLIELRKREEGIKSEKDMLEAIEETREWFAKSHGESAGNNMSMTISYEVFKEK
jgi:hypothetical protein